MLLLSLKIYITEFYTQNNNYACSLFVDFSKAFDMVNHFILGNIFLIALYPTKFAGLCKGAKLDKLCTSL